jgi:hypothetical protein
LSNFFVAFYRILSYKFVNIFNASKMFSICRYDNRSTKGAAVAADETPKVIPLEDLCPDDFSEEERAKFKAAIEKAEAAIAAAIKPEEVAALRNMMTAARAKWDKEDRSRQETSERLRRHQAPAQIGLFKRLDALLEAVKSLPAPSLWQQEALAALLAALEALKSSPVPTPHQ